MRGQQRNVLAALAQGRHFDADDIEPEIKILAEALFRRLTAQVAVGGGQHAYIHGDGRVGTHPLHLALLQGAQQFGLELHGHFADLVQKQRAAVSLDKTALAAAFRAGE